MGKFGILYMGSKDKIAMSICSFLPSAENFYDLFGGGGAITHCMALKKSHKYKNIIYNDIQPGNAEIIRNAIAGKYSYKNFKPPWVSREDFFRLKDKDPYIRMIWSFGNNQKNYLFGKDIEAYKKCMHMAVVFDEFDDIASKIIGFSKWPKTFPETDIKRRRLYFRQRVKYIYKNKSKSELDQLQKLQQLDQLQQLQQLARLERLQQLERLERLELKILTGSYDEVEIKPNSVIYCDPPYKGTAEYLGSFNHAKFFDWAANINHPVYISEYNITDSRFKCVYSIDKRPLLKGGKTINKKKSEKLYWNGK